MEFNTKEFGITVGNVCAHRMKGENQFDVFIKDGGEMMLEFSLKPQEITDLADALGVVLTLTDLNPTIPQAEPIQSTSET